MTQQRRPVFLFDCDGVLSDYSATMLRELRARYGLAEGYGVDRVDRWDYFDEEFPKHSAAIRKDPNFWRCMLVMPTANAALDAAREVGDVYVVTSPDLSCSMWHAARLEWLSLRLDVDERHVIVTKTKHLIDGDCFIDDKPSHVRAWANAHPWGGGDAYLVDAPYNQGAALRRAVDADEAVRDFIRTRGLGSV